MSFKCRRVAQSARAHVGNTLGWGEQSHMIRRHLMALRVALMLGDGATAVAVFLAASFLRFRDGDPTELWRSIGIDIRLAVLLFAGTWITVLWLDQKSVV